MMTHETSSFPVACVAPIKLTNRFGADLGIAKLLRRIRVSLRKLGADAYKRSLDSQALSHKLSTAGEPEYAALAAKAYKQLSDAVALINAADENLRLVDLAVQKAEVIGGRDGQ